MRSCPAPSRSVAVRDPLRRKRSVRAGIKQTGPLRCRRVRPRGRVLCRLSLLRDPRSRIGQGQLRLPPGRRVMINGPGFARSMAQPPSLPARPPQQINTSGTLIGSHRTDWSECGVGADRVPLLVFLWEDCLLVQLRDYVGPERIFSEYAYFSSYVDTLLREAEAYVDEVAPRFDLGASSTVIEIASNDGYLLQYFVKMGIPVLGVEPAANVAEVAETKGIPTMVRFFGVETAEELVRGGTTADLLLGNNVLPHVPDLHDFVGGLKVLLKPGGTITIDFQHLMRMMEGNQF